jgi:plastocyanin
VPRVAVYGAIFLGTLCLLVGMAAATVHGSQPASGGQPGPTLRILAGLGKGIVAAEEFVGDPAFPGGNAVRVAEGTTVIWTLGSDEFHTVTFPAGNPVPQYFIPQPEDATRPLMINPALLFPSLPAGAWDGTTFVHMELQGPGQELPVTFGRPGRYDYVCLFHPAMTGTVEVVASGSAGITSQAAVDQYAATRLATAIEPAVAQLRAMRDRPSWVEGAGNTRIWFVRAGTDSPSGQLDLMAFLPETLTIRQGDTVVWYVDHQMIHTVTFHSAGYEAGMVGEAAPEDFVVVQLPDGRLLPAPVPGEPPPPEVVALFMDPSTAPRLVLGPAATTPVRPSLSYDGRSLYSSGLIGEHPAVAMLMDNTWALSFDTPGTYQYDCVLHESQGMRGAVTVLPR